MRVGGRIDERVAHAGLRSQVQHFFEAGRGEEARDRVDVGDVERLEAEAGRRLQLREPIVLEAHVVVVVQVVDADDVFASCEQRLAGEEADEAGASGDERRHRCSPTAGSASSFVSCAT